jgi:hypothetical protein
VCGPAILSEPPGYGVKYVGRHSARGGMPVERPTCGIATARRQGPGARQAFRSLARDGVAKLHEDSVEVLDSRTPRISASDAQSA